MKPLWNGRIGYWEGVSFIQSGPRGKARHREFSLMPWQAPPELTERRQRIRENAFMRLHRLTAGEFQLLLRTGTLVSARKRPYFTHPNLPWPELLQASIVVDATRFNSMWGLHLLVP